MNLSKIKKQHVKEVFDKLNQGKISKNVILEVLKEYGLGNKPNYSKYEVKTPDNLEQEIKEIIKNNPDLRIGAYMGKIMAKYKGGIDGKKAMEILKKLIK